MLCLDPDIWRVLACAAPVFQLQQLYRYGEVDDCTRHWRDFYNCLKKRTKFANQVGALGRSQAQVVTSGVCAQGGHLRARCPAGGGKPEGCAAVGAAHAGGRQRILAGGSTWCSKQRGPCSSRLCSHQGGLSPGVQSLLPRDLQEQFGSAAAATAEAASTQQSKPAPHDQPSLQKAESEKLTVA